MSAITRRLLVTNGLVLVGDPRERNWRHLDVLSENGRITHMEPDLAESVGRVDKVIDATGHWVVPGFVDTHTTLWQTSMRALTGDWLLDDYFWCIRLNHMLAYTPDDVYAGTYGGAVSQLDAGVTCTVDFSHCVNTPQHADAGVQGIIDAGIRAVWCYGFWSPPQDRPAFASAEERFADARRIASTYFPTENGRVTFGVSPTETFRASYEQIKSEFLVGRETGGLVHPHTNTRWRPGARSDVEVWHEQNILWEHQLHSHCNTSTDRDLALIGEAGAKVSATPETELAMGIGQTIAARADRAGLVVGLGADIQANNSPDALMSMRLALHNDRAWTSQPMLESGGIEALQDLSRLQSEDVLYFATLGGARGLGLGSVCGSLEVGKAADLVLVDTRSPRLAAVTDPVAGLVSQVTVADVATVVVDGVVVKFEGRLDPSHASRASRLLDDSGRRVATAVHGRGGWKPPRPAASSPKNLEGVAIIGDLDVE